MFLRKQSSKKAEDFGAGLGSRSRTLEEQKALLKQQLQQDKKKNSSLRGGGLQDRLRLLEEQRAKDAEKNQRTYTTDESQATDELIRDRVKWLQQMKDDDGNAVEKEAISVEGGNLQDRLRLFEEQKKRDAEKLAEYVTDEAQVTQHLIRDRLKNLEEQNKKKNTAHKEISVEGGNLQDRWRLFEEQKKRDAEKLADYTTDEAHVTQDLIHDRLKSLEEQNRKRYALPDKEAIVVEGGKLKDRLKRLKEQRQLDEAHGHVHPTNESDVTYDFVRDRLAKIQELMESDAVTDAERESIVVEGGKLADRLEMLERQKERDASKLTSFTTSLSQDLIRDRLSWMEKQAQAQSDLPAPVHEIVSHDLVAERMAWLKESAEKANTLPEKERLEATRDLVKQRQAWLDEAKQKAAELPKKEKIEVTQGLLNERIAWLEAEKEKASSMNHSERAEMTTGLIAERLEWLERQYALDASEDIEMQITFLAEQKANADQMTLDEQIVMANALLDEKKQDLENQKAVTADLTEEEIAEVAGFLIDDRQAWLEGTDEKAMATEEPSEEDPLVAESSAALQEVADSISFWTEQKKVAANMNEAEQAEITSFLIQEYISSLEQSAADADDEATRENITVQLEFLREQNENLDSIDHIAMINALIDEKISGLEEQLASLYRKVSSLCVIS